MALLSDQCDAARRAAQAVAELISGRQVAIYLAGYRDDVLRLALRLERCLATEHEITVLFCCPESVAPELAERLSSIAMLLNAAPSGVVCRRRDQLAQSLVDWSNRPPMTLPDATDAILADLRNWASPQVAQIELGVYRHKLKTWLQCTQQDIQAVLAHPDAAAGRELVETFNDPHQWRAAWTECQRQQQALRVAGCHAEDVKSFDQMAEHFAALSQIRFTEAGATASDSFIARVKQAQTLLTQILRLSGVRT